MHDAYSGSILDSVLRERCVRTMQAERGRERPQKNGRNYSSLLGIGETENLTLP